MSIYAEAQALLPDLIRWRRQLHQHAEGGYDLPETLSLVRDVLTAHHVSFFEPCQSTIVCEIGQGPGGMILRADMDALPMQEESGLDFASETAFAHTCGHDLHTTALLGAACLLQAHASELRTRTRLIFQPDEEGITGAEQILAHDLVTPEYQGAFALHVSPALASGVVYHKDGALYASSNEFIVTAKGASTHAAAPHGGRDPIFALVQLYNALQGLISRERPPLEAAVLSICTFHGGSAINVIPGEASLSGTLRTYNEALRAQLTSRIPELCQGVALSTGCELDLRFTTSVPVVDNSAALNARILATLAEKAPDVATALQPEPFAWSEDFGKFASVVPISMMTLGAHVPSCSATIHNADVLFDENALASGVCAHVAAALSVD